MKILTYSERGIVDSLIYSLNDDNAKKLLCKAFPDINTELISDIEFYIEHSLSDFGSPDLVISYKEGPKKIIVFVEAKVSNESKNWTLKNQYKDYCIKNEKNIISNFFRQIALKKLLIANKNNEKFCDGVSNDDIKIMGTKEIRKLGNNKIVRKFFDSVIKDADEFKFLGLVPEYSEFEFNNKEHRDMFSNINYLSWREIKDFAKENQLISLLENFDWNEGIIYYDN